MTTFEIGVTALFVAAFAIGARSTWRLWRRYRDTSPTLTEPRAYLVLVAFVTTSVLITLAAGVIGFLGVRRLLGFDPLTVGSLITTVVAGAVLLIPPFLDSIQERISESGAGTTAGPGADIHEVGPVVDDDDGAP